MHVDAARTGDCPERERKQARQTPAARHGRLRMRSYRRPLFLAWRPCARCGRRGATRALHLKVASSKRMARLDRRQAPRQRLAGVDSAGERSGFQCKTPSWNISQPATALSIRQTVSQNPREFFPQNGLFSSFSMFLRIRGRGRLDSFCRWASGKPVSCQAKTVAKKPPSYRAMQIPVWDAYRSLLPPAAAWRSARPLRPGC